MKYWLILSLVTYCNVGAASTNAPDMQQQIEALKDVVKEQQKILETQQEQLEELIKKSNVEKKKESSSSAILVNNEYGSFTLNGDILLRLESQKYDANIIDNDRFRTRVRLGGLWQSKEKDWEVGIGLTANKASTHNWITWGGNEDFGGNSLDIDYAYARNYIASDRWGNHIFTIGQFRNPLLNAGILWDADITPVGVSYQFAKNGFFGTFALLELVDNVGVRSNIDEKVWMFASQIGYEYKADKWQGKTAFAYYGITTNTEDIVRGSVTKPEDFKFHILQCYSEMSWKYATGKSLGFYSDFWYNIGADGEVADVPRSGFRVGEDVDGEKAFGMVIGSRWRVGKYLLAGDYVYCGAYSNYWLLTDSGFGSGVNAFNNVGSRDVRGVRATLAYDIRKNVQASFVYQYNTRINHYNLENRYGHTFYLNLLVKF